MRPPLGARHSSIHLKAVMVGWAERPASAATFASRSHLGVLNRFEQDLTRTLGVEPCLLRLTGGLASQLGLALFLFDPGALDSGKALGLGAGSRLLGLANGARIGYGLTFGAALLHDRVVQTRPRLEALQQRLLGVG